MKEMNVDIAVLSEAKLMDDRYTNQSFGYEVIAMKAKSVFQGGVALVYRQSEYWQVESVKLYGSNFISFQLVTGSRRYSFMGGGYAPPHRCVDPTVYR
jgi:exonuclease III